MVLGKSKDAVCFEHGVVSVEAKREAISSRAFQDIPLCQISYRFHRPDCVGSLSLLTETTGGADFVGTLTWYTHIRHAANLHSSSPLQQSRSILLFLIAKLPHLTQPMSGGAERILQLQDFDLSIKLANTTIHNAKSHGKEGY